MTDITFLGQLRPRFEAMRARVATLTILRHSKEAHASRLQTSDMTLGASDLPVMFRQGKIRYLMLERIAAAYGLPINDTECTPLVLGVTLDAVLAAKCHMQATGMKRRCMAR